MDLNSDVLLSDRFEIVKKNKIKIKINKLK